MGRRALPVIPEGFKDDRLPTGLFSPSQYGLYKQICAKAYEFKYVLKQRSPPSVAMSKGVVVHDGAEFTHKRLIETRVAPSLEEVRAVIADSFKEKQKEIVDWEDLQPGKVQDEALSLYGVYHREAVPKLYPIEAEQEVLGHIGTVPVLVYIDLIDHEKGPTHGGVEDPGRLVVADMKTSKATWSEADLQKDPQFTAYSLLKNIPTVRVDNLVPLKAGPKLTQRTALRTSQDYAVLTEDYEEVVDNIKKGSFPRAPIEHWSCGPKGCGYWTQCRGRKY